MNPPRAAALAAALLATAVFPDAAPAAPPEPEGYRGEPYRAPVPATLDGAQVIDALAAHALHEAGAAFIDVLPRPERPANLPEGTIWRDPPHDTIPGAFWLANTGYDALAPETLAYFLAGLSAATNNDTTAAMVIFCQRDCWMSWNAARRAIEHGYTSVAWFPEGVDGWTFEDLPTERATPWAP